MSFRFRASLTNCYFLGEYGTDYDDGWVRDRTELRLGRNTVVIVQRSDCTRKKKEHIGKAVVTTDVDFGTVDAKAKAKRMADDLAYLLQFATLSPVEVALYQFGPNSNRPTFFGVTPASGPLVPPQGHRMRVFLENAWPVYRQTKGQRNLPHMIEYLVFARRDRTPIEIQAGLVMIALEGLKASYAHAVGYPLLGMMGRKRYCDPAARRPERSPLGFARLLDEMFDSVGMKGGRQRVINLRNQLLHTGLALRESRALLRVHHDTYDRVCEYLLRLFRYKGEFCAANGSFRSLETVP